MKFLTLLLVIFAVPVPVVAQTWAPEQLEIWKLEEEMWRRDNAKDFSWIETYVHPSFTVWNLSAPLPRNRASLLRWDKVDYQVNSVIEFELFPISVTVTPTTAVAHYRTLTATEDLKGNREQSATRETDVFIKEAGKWRLIAVVGGDEPKR